MLDREYLIGNSLSKRRQNLVALVAALLAGALFGWGEVRSKAQVNARGMLVAADRGRPEALPPAVSTVRLSQNGGEGAAWSPNGRWIAIPDRSGITLRNIETAVRRHLRAPAPRAGQLEAQLSWSRDGRTLRYVTSHGPARGRGHWLTTIRYDGSMLRQAPLGIQARETTWAPDGWPLAFATGPYGYELEGEIGGPQPPRSVPVGPEPSIWTVAGFGDAPRKIFSSANEILTPAFSPDGASILFVESGREGRVMAVDADGSSPRPIAGRLRSAYAAWSPGGKRVALVVTTWRGDLRQHLYTVAARGGRLRRLSAEEVQDGPAWSPDGRWIAFANFESEIRMVHPNGRGETVVAQLPGKEIADLRWSPDSRRLAYAARPIQPSDRLPDGQ
jgi:Tol biopolymer transport system component